MNEIRKAVTDAAKFTAIDLKFEQFNSNYVFVQIGKPVTASRYLPFWRIASKEDIKAQKK